MRIIKRGELWRDRQGCIHTSNFHIEGGDLGDFEAWCEWELARLEDRQPRGGQPSGMEWYAGFIAVVALIFLIVVGLR